MLTGAPPFSGLDLHRAPGPRRASPAPAPSQRRRLPSRGRGGGPPHAGEGAGGTLAPHRRRDGGARRRPLARRRSASPRAEPARHPARAAVLEPPGRPALRRAPATGARPGVEAARSAASPSFRHRSGSRSGTVSCSWRWSGANGAPGSRRTRSPGVPIRRACSAWRAAAGSRRRWEPGSAILTATCRGVEASLRVDVAPARADEITHRPARARGPRRRRDPPRGERPRQTRAAHPAPGRVADRRPGHGHRDRRRGVDRPDPGAGTDHGRPGFGEDDDHHSGPARASRGDPHRRAARRDGRRTPSTFRQHRWTAGARPWPVGPCSGAAAT